MQIEPHGTVAESSVTIRHPEFASSVFLLHAAEMFARSQDVFGATQFFDTSLNAKEVAPAFEWRVSIPSRGRMAAKEQRKSTRPAGFEPATHGLEVRF